MTDDELLAIVKAERLRSIGFDHDEELRASRERALNYRKGVMPDVPSLPNRSSAVSTDLADAVETVLPDLIEIFTGGDDVAAFLATPKSTDKQEIDRAEAQAQQETDYVNHVVFEQNPGFMILNAMFKDALEVKTGIVKWWWEEADEVEPEQFEGKTLVELQLALQNGGKLVGDPTPSKYDDADDQPAEPTYDFALEKEGEDGRVCIEAVAPEDFTVSPDTVRLKDAPYCAHKSRPRAQDLIARGIDPELVDKLGAYDQDDDGIKLARDTAGENDNATTNEATRKLRQVEVIEHYIRINEGDKPKIWRVLTGKDEALLLDKEEVSEIQFAAITPFVVTHRFYGESLADKLMEVQKIKTVLTRMQLDSGYFALNQRMTVDMTKANEFTISDLLRNEPAMPIRVNGDGAVLPVSAGALQFDVMGALEYWSTVTEHRTGIVRNAQGLNPDTLHDTAKGAMALMAAAQKRVRMIARVFAEMGVKDLFLGVHALLRRHCSKPAITRLRGSWVAVDPTTWAERDNMVIEVGLGASGAEHELQVLQMLTPMIEGVITQQGGLNGPILRANNLYELLKRTMEKAKLKGVERYLTDPDSEEEKKRQAQTPPKPDPEMVKAQVAAQQAAAKAQQDAQKAQNDLQIAQQKHGNELQLQSQKNEIALQLQRQQNALEIQFERDKAAEQLRLQREQAAAELDLKEREMQMQFELQSRAQDHKESMAQREAETNIDGPKLGGKPG